MHSDDTLSDENFKVIDSKQDFRVSCDETKVVILTITSFNSILPMEGHEVGG